MATKDEFMEAIKDAYKQLDTNKDGQVSRSELKQLLVEMFGPKVPDVAVDDVMKNADKDGSGTINTIEEMLDAFCHIEIILICSELMAHFKSFDKNGDGKLTKAELEAGFAKLGSDPAHKDEIKDLITKADVDGDGKVDCQEFVCFIMEQIMTG